MHKIESPFWSKLSINHLVFALKMNDLQIGFATNLYPCHECYLTWANFNKLKTRQGNASLRLLQVVLLQQKGYESLFLGIFKGLNLSFTE